MTHSTMLEARLGRYGATEIDAMRGLLERKPEARDLLVSMHRGPDLILPAGADGAAVFDPRQAAPGGHFSIARCTRR
jgi:hypothetical protein